jgi:SecD/SecF fusion protein
LSTMCLFKKYTYQECKEREINLGLDLKGGMNVILEIAVEDIIRSIAAPQYLTDPVFTETMALAKEKKVNSQAILWTCLPRLRRT